MVVAERDRRMLPVLGLLGAAIGFAALQAMVHAIAGVFEYPLDDPYIHLAMARGIARGTYGINPGEPASAASSALYPLLLVPFAGTALQQLLPFFWNLIAVLGCGWIWGQVLILSGIGGAAGMVLALVGPVALNMPGVAFTGMEHELHALASLAILLGFWRYLQDGRISGGLVAAAILAPALRLEGLALPLAVAGAVALRGRPGAGAALGAAALAPVVAFSAFLMSQGLGPLPSSVVAKIVAVSPGHSFFGRFAANFVHNLQTFPGWLLTGLVLATAVLPALLPDLRRGPARWLLSVLGLAGVAHLLVAQIGWMNRYEHYIFVTLVAGLLIALSQIGGGAARMRSRVATLLLLLGIWAYLPDMMRLYVWNTRTIHLQQDQMARFAHDFFPEPVAVNDIGRVAWGSPAYVLDLWGLASSEALHIRTSPGAATPGWAAPLAARHGVRLAMVYDIWLAPAVGPDWVALAHLTMDHPRGAVGDVDVTFYATSPAAVPAITAALRRFIPTLPAEAHLTLTGAAP